jgi:ubiquitin-protein ligase
MSSSTGSILRLSSDYKSIVKDKPDGVIDVVLVYDDITNWRVFLECIDTRPMRGAIVTLDIRFGPNYPFEQPIVKFVNQIFHPNVDFTTGLLCSDGKWSVTYDVRTLLLTIRSLLTYPCITNDGSETPVNLEAAVAFATDSDTYFQICRD